MNRNWIEPATEADRQRAVADYGLDDAPDWPAADAGLLRLVAMSQRLLGAEFSAINILDGDQQSTIVGSAGVPVSVCERSMSLCQRLLAATSSREGLIVANASLDPRLVDSPFVNGELSTIRFFAAAPLIGREGLVLGTLCIWSGEPATLGSRQQKQLTTICDAVMAILEGRRSRAELSRPARSSSPLPARREAEPLPSTRRPASAWSIDAIIDDRAIRTVFQPIVHLATGTVAGFEALSRGPAGSPLEMPIKLIEAAQQAGRLGELDWLCRTHAMQAAAAANLHPSVSWFINVEPAGLGIDCPPHLLPSFRQARTDLRVILEVVERDVEGYVCDLLYATDQARSDSWGVALDDVGAEEASLALLPLLRPDVVKLDMSLVRQAPAQAAAAVTAAVRAYAEPTGAVILAEGIETQEQHELARVLGATYGQGYRFGRPGPLPESVPAPRHVVPLRQNLTPLAGVTPFEALNALLGDPSRGSKCNLLHISRHLEHQSAASEDASVLLASFQNIRYFTDRQQRRYADLARGNALTVVLAEGLAAEAEPRYQRASPHQGSRVGQEWIVILISPHHAVAFVARDCGDAVGAVDDPAQDLRRRFDYYYTHDRDAVIAAARAYLQELKPSATVTGSSHSAAAPRAFAPSAVPRRQPRARRRGLL